MTRRTKNKVTFTSLAPLTELYDVIDVIGVFLHHDLHNPNQLLMPDESSPASTAEIAALQSCIESIKLEVIKKELATQRTFNTCWETINRVENLLNDDADAQTDAQNQEYYSSHHVLFLLTILQTANLTKRLSTDAEAQIADLHTKIKEIYACVNMDVRHALI
jgi:hypothetical protein